MLHDLRFAWRMLKRSPVFTVTALLILAVGIGATTTLFSAVYAVLLRPLPFADPDRLVTIWHQDRDEGVDRSPLAYDTFRDLEGRARTLEAFAGLMLDDVTVRVGDDLERVPAAFVSAAFFDVLGVPPARGRTFRADEDRPGSPVVIVSEGLWSRVFGADTPLTDQALIVGGDSLSIIGIAPRGFRFLGEADVWRPVSSHVIVTRFAERLRAVRWITGVARVGPDASIDAARSEMATLMRQLEAAHPETNQGLSATVLPLHEEIAGAIEPALWLLFGAVGVLLLVMSVNVSNLLLARSVVRRRELAIRTALGAGRRRLLRQIVGEGVLLAFGGAVLGLLVAVWTLDLLLAIAPEGLPRFDEIALDWPVLGFATLIAAGVGVLFGVLSAADLLRGDVGSDLQVRRGAGQGRTLRHALIVAEQALALVLVLGAALLARSFVNVMAVDPGFRADGVWTAFLGLPSAGYEEDSRRRTFYDDLFDGLAALPDVDVAAGTNRLPLGGGITATLEIFGRPVAAADRPEVETRRASAGYFGAMGIPLEAGRTFGPDDGPDRPRVAIVTQTAARRFWPDGDAVDAQLRLGASSDDSPWWTVIGVVGDVRHFGLDEPAAPEVYLPYTQGPPQNSWLAVRVRGNPADATTSIRGVLSRLEPEAVISDVVPMSVRLDRSIGERRFTMWLMQLFAVLALVLAIAGVFGVMSYLVGQRTGELAVRLALGASPRTALLTVLQDGVRLTLVGTAIGAIAALFLSGWLSTLLFGVDPRDPGAFATSAGLLILASLAACLVPALRAMRVDPASVLRAE